MGVTWLHILIGHLLSGVLDWCGSKIGHQKATCSKGIGQRACIFLTIIVSRIKITIGGIYVWSFHQKLESLQFENEQDIHTWRLKTYAKND